jgi:hypothetical protein
MGEDRIASSPDLSVDQVQGWRFRHSTPQQRGPMLPNPGVVFEVFLVSQKADLEEIVA